MAQSGDGRLALLGAVDQVLLEGADDAVAAGVDLADMTRMPCGGLYDPGR